MSVCSQIIDYSTRKTISLQCHVNSHLFFLQHLFSWWNTLYMVHWCNGACMTVDCGFSPTMNDFSFKCVCVCVFFNRVFVCKIVIVSMLSIYNNENKRAESECIYNIINGSSALLCSNYILLDHWKIKKVKIIDTSKSQ